MKLKLISKTEEARATKSFFFQPDNPIFFTPGQYFYLTLPKLNYPDERGATRHFTMSSSLTESNLLRFTTRIRPDSGYKKTLDELPIGTVVEGQGPNGTFTFDEKDTNPHVFLAGGIGITAFRSMIEYISGRKLQTPIYLIYSNSESDFVFKKDFDEITKSHPNIQIQYVVTSIEGHLDELKIGKFIENWKLTIGNCSWWVCGPPPFIDGIEEALAKMKISSDKIRTEKFTGY